MRLGLALPKYTVLQSRRILISSDMLGQEEAEAYRGSGEPDSQGEQRDAVVVPVR